MSEGALGIKANYWLTEISFNVVAIFICLGNLLASIHEDVFDIRDPVTRVICKCSAVLAAREREDVPDWISGHKFPSPKSLAATPEVAQPGRPEAHGREPRARALRAAEK